MAISLAENAYGVTRAFILSPSVTQMKSGFAA